MLKSRLRFEGFHGKKRLLVLVVSIVFAFSGLYPCVPVKAAEGIVIDNGDPGYSESGTWSSTSNVRGYENSDTRFSYTPGAYARWALTPEAGVYEVFIYKTVHSSCDTAARIEVGQGSQVKSAAVMDYTQGTSGWVSLGLYGFNNASEAYVKNTRSGAAARADAVKFVRSGVTMAELSCPANTEAADVDSDIVITFSSAMDRDTLNPNNIVLKETAGDTVVEAIYSISADNRVFTINPAENLKYDRSYTVVIGQDVYDAGGKNIYGTNSWEFVTAPAVVLPDPVVVDFGHPGYTEYSSWADSGLSGYNGTGTRYGLNSDCYASWQPELTAGTYEVFIYKVVHANSDTNAKIDISHASGIDTVYLNYTQGTSGWVSLGVYDFSEGNGGYVRNTRNGSGTIRADAVMFQQIFDPALATLTSPSSPTEVAVDAPMEISFNRDMDISTMNLRTILLKELAGGVVVDTLITADENGRLVTIVPLQNLKYNNSYSLTISEDVRDTDGKPVYGITAWSFNTELDSSSRYIVIEPEDFLFDPGTWTIENATDAFGGRYLISAKNEMPAGSVPARMVFSTDMAGSYRIWIHTKDYTTLQGTRNFKARVNGVLQDELFGDHGVNGWSWENGGTVQLDAGENILELVDTSAFYARVDGIFLTNQLDSQPPASYTELERVSQQNTGMQQKLAFPQWAMTDAQPDRELTIGNENVRVSFYSVPAAEGQVIQKQMSVKSGDGWIPAEDRTDPFGYLLMYSENTPASVIHYNTFSYLKTNKLNRELEWLVPAAMEAAGDGRVRLTAENSYARLTALWEVTGGDQEPKVTVTMEAKQQGTYSLGMFGGKEKTLREIDSLLLPFQLTGKQLPDEFYVVPEWLASTPVSLMSLTRQDGSRLTYGIAADSSSIPDRWARSDDSKFGLSIKGLQGGVQPSAFAPLFGSEDSVFTQGQTYVFAYRPFVQEGEWFEAYKHVVSDIYNMEDARENYYSSFTDAIFNTQELAMDDDHSGWNATAKAHYNIEGKNVVSMASPLTYIQAYLLTEDQDVYERRTLPTIEAMMTRERLHYTETGDTDAGGINYLGSNVITPVGSPVNGYGNNTIGGAYAMTRSLTSVLKAAGIDSGIKNETSYTQVPEWHQNLALYKYTRNTAYLELAKSGANDYLENTIYKTVYAPPTDLEFANISYVPYWSGLIDLYEETGDEKYIQGAAYAAQKWIVTLWTQPGSGDGEKTIYADDVRDTSFYPEDFPFWKGPEQHRIGYPEGLDNLQDETVPGWLNSRTGLGLEQKVTFMINNAANIQLSPWAPDLLRLAQYTGEDIYETFARNAMIGRFSNYPGYYTNQYAVQQMKSDYPYNGPDQTGIYYHHIPVQLGLNVDFLVTQIWKWSDGKINFPSVREQGYAFFNNRHYGFAAGSFFDENDMWMWLKEGLITLDNIQIDWLAARKDGRFATALINEDTAEQTVTVTLGEEVTGGTAYNGTAAVYDAGGNKTTAEIVDSQVTLTVPGHGLVGIALDSEAVRKPAFADVPADEIFNSPDDSTVVSTGPTAEFGKGMVIQIDPDSYDAYVYTTFMPDKASKAILYWHTGDGNWKQSENGTYPYEFTVKVEDMSKTFHYYVKVLDKDGNWLASNEAELKPKVYFKEALLNADRTSLAIGEEALLTATAVMSDKKPAGMDTAVVSFESSDPAVIEVTGQRAIAKSAGYAFVKAVAVIDGIRRESEEVLITAG